MFSLWVCSLPTKMFLLYLVFSTLSGSGVLDFSLEGWIFYGPSPFSKLIFSKSSRASTHQFWARSDRPFSRKMTFLLKIDLFEKCKSGQLPRHWRLPASNGLYQSIRRTLYCKMVVFLWFHLFYFLKNDPFFMKKWQKVVLKIVHFLLNYATFVFHIYSQDLWNFPKLTLWECLFHTKTFLLYIVFPTMRGGQWQFSLKKNDILWPPFSKFSFPKSSRASAHQFWTRSDQPFSRKMTFFV